MKKDSYTLESLSHREMQINSKLETLNNELEALNAELAEIKDMESIIQKALKIYPEIRTYGDAKFRLKFF